MAPLGQPWGELGQGAQFSPVTFLGFLPCFCSSVLLCVYGDELLIT